VLEVAREQRVAERGDVVYRELPSALRPRDVVVGRHLVFDHVVPARTRARASEGGNFLSASNSLGRRGEGREVARDGGDDRAMRGDAQFTNERGRAFPSSRHGVRTTVQRAKR